MVEGWATRGHFNLDDEMTRPQRHGRRSPSRVVALVLRALRLARHAARRELTSFFAVQVFAALLLAGQVLVIREVIAAVLALPAGVDTARLVGLLAVLALASALLAFAGLLRSEQQRVLGELVSQHAMDRVIAAATSVDLLTLEHPDFHDRLERARLNAAMRPMQMVNGLLGVVSATIAIAGIGAALLVLQPLLLAFVVAAYGPAWLAGRKASRIIYAYSVKQTPRDRRRDYLFHVLTRRDEAKEVRSFGLAPFLRRQHAELHQLKLADLRQAVRRRLKVGLAGSGLSAVLAFGVVALLLWLLAAGWTDLSTAGTAAVALVLLTQRLRSLTASAGTLYEGALFLEDFTSFVDAVPPAAEDQAPTAAQRRGFNRLRADGVTFTYPTRTEPALKGVSLDIHRGEVVALVGLNGSGKTTLAKVLSGLYGPDHGSVTWDGVDMRDIDQGELRRSVAILFQDFVKYVLSAHDNIAIGEHERFEDRDAVVQAARRAGADDALSALEHGYDTVLGPEFLGGSDLSGGQWQRVALARAFFRDAPLVILDEPTASLDPRAEATLFERVRALFEGRTVLLISHRFSSARSADRIVVLDQGCVVEVGTHRELMAQDGMYADLFTQQASAYLADGDGLAHSPAADEIQAAQGIREPGER